METERKPQDSTDRAKGNASPLDTLARLSREVDQLVDSFFGGRFSLSGRPRGSTFDAAGATDLWSPRVDVRERSDSIVICVELPGVQKDAVEIEAVSGGIAISGERHESREEGDMKRGYRLAERSYGSFYRNIPLPEGAQVDQAKASMKDGVLEVTVPLKKDAQRRKIQITE
jgi:HSP20 family protein